MDPVVFIVSGHQLVVGIGVMGEDRCVVIVAVHLLLGHIDLAGGGKKNPVRGSIQLSIGPLLKANTFSLTNFRHQPSPGSVFMGFNSAVTEIESPVISCTINTDKDIMTAATNPNLIHFILKYTFLV